MVYTSCISTKKNDLRAFSTDDTEAFIMFIVFTKSCRLILFSVLCKFHNLIYCLMYISLSMYIGLFWFQMFITLESNIPRPGHVHD